MTTLIFEPATTSTAAARWVEMFASTVQPAIDALAEATGFVGPKRLTVVVADDFAGEVRKRMASNPSAQAFTTDRVGGIVAGKNLPVPGDPDAGLIVLNMECHDFADTTEGAGQLRGAFTLVHEMLHPPLTWTREASGVLAGEREQSSTPSECARGIVARSAFWYR
jgi:hypothetical protein